MTTSKHVDAFGPPANDKAPQPFPLPSSSSFLLLSKVSTTPWTFVGVGTFDRRPNVLQGDGGPPRTSDDGADKDPSAARLINGEIVSMSPLQLLLIAVAVLPASASNSTECTSTLAELAEVFFDANCLCVKKGNDAIHAVSEFMNYFLRGTLSSWVWDEFDFHHL